ncbi:elongin-A isoform X2 [Rhinatrema bivittatum]|uniref:elongin-A isoform X2 n=1 Tax=Rhinatrema bivittatum TaxID=194408 RepID=UPI00112D8F62|nr:elongin-A isoform X2 [Rhinatrema bivittatum]
MAHLLLKTSLLKSLKRLAELPVTVDILAETGVGKTVNSLRKHEIVGDFAKNLVARWKKLVPQEVERNSVESEEREYEKTSSRKRQRAPSPKDKGDLEDNYGKTFQQHHSQSEREKKLKKYSETDRLGGYNSSESWHQPFRGPYSDPEYSDDEQGQLAQLSSSPPDYRSEVQESRCQRKTNRNASDKPDRSQERSQSGFLEKSTPSQSKEHKSAHKEKHRIDAKGEDKNSWKVQPQEVKLQSIESGDHSAKREKQRESGLVFRPQPLSEELLDSVVKQKHRDPEKLKTAKSQNLNKEKSSSEKEVNSLSKNREKVGKSKKHEEKSKICEITGQEKKSVVFSPGLEEVELDEYEQPTMSFESYLSYDQPQKKKKKLVRTPAPVPEREGRNSKQNGSKTIAKSSDASKKHKDQKESKKRESSPTKPKKMKIEVVPALPDIPLPPIQPNYRPLPSIEAVQKKKVLSSPVEEEDAGFTGRRLNSKMQVYSGSKTAYLPKMMSLYQQCIRVLANNIDSIYEVGGVPFSVLEPVLEKCTPEQLYRIEECNHVLVEDTDRLWMQHCQRDFKNEKAEEFESWREMYLRLHDAREQRLLMLTQNIRSAHANKPKCRQAKMAFVNSEAKPPRDVRRRQEKFGTGGAAVMDKIRIKPVLFTPVSSSINSNTHSEDQQIYDGPSTSSAHSCAPVSCVTPAAHDPRRPQVKKIAPMMAKTIKAFKNRFSRR